MKIIQREIIAFGTNGARTNGYLHVKEWNWTGYSKYKNQLKIMKDMNVKAKTIKLLGKKIGVNLHDR